MTEMAGHTQAIVSVAYVRLLLLFILARQLPVAHSMTRVGATGAAGRTYREFQVMSRPESKLQHIYIYVYIYVSDRQADTDTDRARA